MPYYAILGHFTGTATGKRILDDLSIGNQYSAPSIGLKQETRVLCFKLMKYYLKDKVGYVFYYFVAAKVLSDSLNLTTRIFSPLASRRYRINFHQFSTGRWWKFIKVGNG